MEINRKLITLYTHYVYVGSAVASVTSLDGGGRRVIGIRAPNMGSTSGELFDITPEEFKEYYEFNDGSSGCFVLYRLKNTAIELAKKHKKCLKILEEDQHE